MPVDRSTSYSWEEVRKHSKEDDAWIVIDGKVYDVSEYMPTHPGGAQLLTPWLGKDATEAFATKAELKLDHSDAAKAQLADLQIGVIAKRDKAAAS